MISSVLSAEAAFGGLVPPAEKQSLCGGLFINIYKQSTMEFTQVFGLVLPFRTTRIHPGFWVRITVPDHLSSPRVLGSCYRSGPPEFTQGFGFVLPFRITRVHPGFWVRFD